MQVGHGPVPEGAVNDAPSEIETAGIRTELGRIGGRCAERSQTPIPRDQEIECPAAGAAQLEGARGDAVALIGQGGDGVLQVEATLSIATWRRGCFEAQRPRQAAVRGGCLYPAEAAGQGLTASFVSQPLSMPYTLEGWLVQIVQRLHQLHAGM